MKRKEYLLKLLYLLRDTFIDWKNYGIDATMVNRETKKIMHIDEIIEYYDNKIIEISIT